VLANNIPSRIGVNLPEDLLFVPVRHHQVMRTDAKNIRTDWRDDDVNNHATTRQSNASVSFCSILCGFFDFLIF
jgi:hypothetical protein